MANTVRDFLWLGNHPATDLVNTEPIVAGVGADLLGDIDAIVSWAQRSGVTRDRRSFEFSRSEAARTLSFVRRLRAVLRDALSADRLDPDEARAVNEILREAPGTLHVERASGMTSLTATAPAAQLRVRIAAATTEIFRHDLRRVRSCANQACVLMFLDISRSGRRRWCDMASCGNRAKAAAHHARAKS